MSTTEILAILMLVAFFGLLMAGVPVALTLATTGFVFGFLGFGTGLFNLLPARATPNTASGNSIAYVGNQLSSGSLRVA